MNKLLLAAFVLMSAAAYSNVHADIRMSGLTGEISPPREPIVRADPCQGTNEIIGGGAEWDPCEITYDVDPTGLVIYTAGNPAAICTDLGGNVVTCSEYVNAANRKFKKDLTGKD
jgi:hypothetical protein